MIDAGGCLILLLILGIVYAVIIAIEEKVDSDFDEVTEAKCKKCLMYDACPRHGRDYNCRDYMTDEILRKKGDGME